MLNDQEQRKLLESKLKENIIYAEVKLFSSKETAANFRPES